VDFTALRALATGINFSVLGLPVLVTRPHDADIETTGIWLTATTDGMPGAGEFRRQEVRRVMAIRRVSEIESVPRGSVVTAREYDCGPEQRWIVDGVERVEQDHVRVILVPEA
jgi:hypothetical protein